MDFLLLTSDWHETPFAQVKFETQKESLGEKIIQLLGGAGKPEVMKKMAEILKMLEITIVVNNGDLQENSKNEQGIVISDDSRSVHSIVENFERRHKVRMLLNGGNHELGYDKTSQPLATDPNGGISSESIANFTKLVGSGGLYQSFLIYGYRIVLIPYLITEKCAKNFDIESEKTRILHGLLRDLQDEEKVILFIHDPDSLMDQRLVNLIREHKHNISLIFCGHYHAQLTLTAVRWLIRICNWKILTPIRWMLRLMLKIAFDSEISKAVQESYRERKEIPSLMDEFDVQIIPAPGGMLGFGGGFLTLELDTLEVTKS